MLHLQPDDQGGPQPKPPGGWKEGEKPPDSPKPEEKPEDKPKEQ